MKGATDYIRQPNAAHGDTNRPDHTLGTGHLPSARSVDGRGNHFSARIPTLLKQHRVSSCLASKSLTPALCSTRNLDFDKEKSFVDAERNFPRTQSAGGTGNHPHSSGSRTIRFSQISSHHRL